MKQFDLKFPSIRRLLKLSLAVFFLGIFSSQAQTYRANMLSGAQEAPPNNSAGTGYAEVVINGNMMILRTTFSGLSGITTASHIHAPTTVAGSGTAGVATTTPTFPGFPLGVTAGAYDMAFDMTQASSFNAAFITNNGGTTTTAFETLKAALNNGMAYLNIHTTDYPGGEIRGFFVPCMPINVTIPDAFALSEGVLPNTVYPAYPPASSLTLSAMISGGTGPYTYVWSNGTTGTTMTVSPTHPTQYSLAVMDQIGCIGTTTKQIDVVDVSGGRNGDRILVCHQGNHALEMNANGNGVAAHLKHGDMLGPCPNGIRGIPMATTEETEDLSIAALSNPSSNYFDLRISGKAGVKTSITVYDFQGRVIETKEFLQLNDRVRIGSTYKPGTYIIQVVQGAARQNLKLVKL